MSLPVSTSPAMSTENNTPEGLSSDSSSEPVAGGTWERAWFCKSKPIVVHTTARNTSCPMISGVHCSAGTRGSNAHVAASENRPTNRNIHEVSTLTSRVRPIWPTTAISTAKNIAPTSVSRSPIWMLKLSSATKPTPTRHISAEAMCHLVTRSRNSTKAMKGTRMQYVPVRNAFLPGVVSTRPSVCAAYADQITHPMSTPNPRYSRLKCALMRLWKITNMMTAESRKRHDNSMNVGTVSSTVFMVRKE